MSDFEELLNQGPEDPIPGPGPGPKAKSVKIPSAPAVGPGFKTWNQDGSAMAMKPGAMYELTTQSSISALSDITKAKNNERNKNAEKESATGLRSTDNTESTAAIAEFDRLNKASKEQLVNLLPSVKSQINQFLSSDGFRWSDAFIEDGNERSLETGNLLAYSKKQNQIINEKFVQARAEEIVSNLGGGEIIRRQVQKEIRTALLDKFYTRSASVQTKLKVAEVVKSGELKTVIVNSAGDLVSRYTKDKQSADITKAIAPFKARAAAANASAAAEKKAAQKKIDEEDAPVFKAINDSYEPAMNGLQDEYIQTKKAEFDGSLSSRAQIIKAAHSRGEMTTEVANKAIDALNQESSVFYENLPKAAGEWAEEEFKKQYGPQYQKEIDAAIALNTAKKKKALSIIKKENDDAIDKINKDIKGATEKYYSDISAAEKIDNEKIGLLSARAYQEVMGADIRYKQARRDIKYLESTAGIGLVKSGVLQNTFNLVKGYGEFLQYMGVDNSKVQDLLARGREGSQRYEDPMPEIKSIKDIFRPDMLAQGLGQLAYSIPGLFVGGAFKILKVPSLITRIASTAAAWTSNTAMMVGGVEQQMIEAGRTPAEARRGANEHLQFQVSRIPSEYFMSKVLFPSEGATFGKKVYNAIANVGIQAADESIEASMEKGSIDMWRAPVMTYLKDHGAIQEGLMTMPTSVMFGLTGLAFGGRHKAPAMDAQHVTNMIWSNGASQPAVHFSRMYMEGLMTDDEYAKNEALVNRVGNLIEDAKDAGITKLPQVRMFVAINEQITTLKAKLEKNKNSSAKTIITAAIKVLENNLSNFASNPEKIAQVDLGDGIVVSVSAEAAESLKNDDEVKATGATPVILASDEAGTASIANGNIAAQSVDTDAVKETVSVSASSASSSVAELQPSDISRGLASELKSLVDSMSSGGFSIQKVKENLKGIKQRLDLLRAAESGNTNKKVREAKEGEDPSSIKTVGEVLQGIDDDIAAAEKSLIPSTKKGVSSNEKAGKGKEAEGLLTNNQEGALQQEPNLSATISSPVIAILQDNPPSDPAARMMAEEALTGDRDQKEALVETIVSEAAENRTAAVESWGEQTVEAAEVAAGKAPAEKSSGTTKKKSVPKNVSAKNVEASDNIDPEKAESVAGRRKAARAAFSEWLNSLDQVYSSLSSAGKVKKMQAYLARILAAKKEGIITSEEFDGHYKRITSNFQKLNVKEDQLQKSVDAAFAEVESGNVTYGGVDDFYDIADVEMDSDNISDINKVLKSSDLSPIEKRALLAAKAIIKALAPLNIRVAIHYNARGLAAATGWSIDKASKYGGVFDNESGVIRFNLENIGARIATGKGRTFWHEAIHPLLNVMANSSPEQYRALVDGIKRELKSGNLVVAAIKEWVDKNYTDATDEEKWDEVVTEFLAAISNDEVSWNSLPKTMKETIVDFINKILSAAGIKYRVNAGNGVFVKEVAKKIYRVLRQGESAEVLIGSGKDYKRYFAEQASLSPKGRDAVVANAINSDKRVLNNLTEDENGNYVFFHRSDKDLRKSGIDPKRFGSNTNKTGRQEAQRQIPASFYYTTENYSEPGMGGFVHVVRVAKNEVYPFNRDPLNLVDAAYDLFARENKNSNLAFDFNNMVGYVGKVAQKYGYKMVVAHWSPYGKRVIRAESVEKLSAELYRRNKPGTLNQIEYADGKKFSSSPSETFVRNGDRKGKQGAIGNATVPSDFTKENIQNLLSKDDWAIITATKEAVGDYDHPQNLADNVKLKSDLIEEFGRDNVIPMTGEYLHIPNGEVFGVAGISLGRAMQIGRDNDQQSIFASLGNVFTDGSGYNPSLGQILVGDDAAKEDGYTILPDGTKISALTGWDRKLPMPLQYSMGAADIDLVNSSPVTIETAAKFATESSFARGIFFKDALQKMFKPFVEKLKERYGPDFDPKYFGAYEEARKLARKPGWTKERVEQMYKDAHDYLSTALTQEALIAIKNFPEAIGWYDEKTQQAMAVMALVHPELINDIDQRSLFTLITAITSNGNKVNENFSYAEQQYGYYKANKSFDTSMEMGAQQSGIKASLSMINDMMKEMTISELTAFFVSQHTASDLSFKNAAGKRVGLAGIELPGNTVFGASILGSKIGNGFYMNLWGYFDQLTIDRWFMRMWGRVTGNLLKKNPKLLLANKDRLQAALDKAVKSNPAMNILQNLLWTGTDSKKKYISVDPSMDIIDLAYLIRKLSGNPKTRAILSKHKITNEIRLASNRYVDNIEGHIESPASGYQLNFIRDVFEAIRQNLSDLGIQITMADLQAALWYPEKILYESAKKGRSWNTEVEKYKTKKPGEEAFSDPDEDDDDKNTSAEDEGPPDYLEAAKKIAKLKGYTNEQINAALEQHAARRRSESASSADRVSKPGGPESIDSKNKGIDAGEKAKRVLSSIVAQMVPGEKKRKEERVSKKVQASLDSSVLGYDPSQGPRSFRYNAPPAGPVKGKGSNAANERKQRMHIPLNRPAAIKEIQKAVADHFAMYGVELSHKRVVSLMKVVAQIANTGKASADVLLSVMEQIDSITSDQINKDKLDQSKDLVKKLKSLVKKGSLIKDTYRSLLSNVIAIAPSMSKLSRVFGLVNPEVIDEFNSTVSEFLESYSGSQGKRNITKEDIVKFSEYLAFLNEEMNKVALERKMESIDDFIRSIRDEYEDVVNDGDDRSFDEYAMDEEGFDGTVDGYMELMDIEKEQAADKRKEEAKHKKESEDGDRVLLAKALQEMIKEDLDDMSPSVASVAKRLSGVDLKSLDAQQVKNILDVLNNVLNDHDISGAEAFLQYVAAVDFSKKLSSMFAKVRKLSVSASGSLTINNLFERLFFGEEVRDLFTAGFYQEFRSGVNKAQMIIFGKYGNGGVINEIRAIAKRNERSLSKLSQKRIGIVNFINQVARDMYGKSAEENFNGAVQKIIDANIVGMYDHGMRMSDKTGSDVMQSAVDVADAMRDLGLIQGYTVTSTGINITNTLNPASSFIDTSQNVSDAGNAGPLFDMLTDGERAISDYMRALANDKDFVDGVADSAMSVFGLDFERVSDYFPLVTKKFNQDTRVFSMDGMVPSTNGFKRMSVKPGDRNKKRSAIAPEGVFYNLDAIDSFVGAYYEGLAQTHAASHAKFIQYVMNNADFRSFINGVFNKQLGWDVKSEHFKSISKSGDASNFQIFSDQIMSTVSDEYRPPYLYRSGAAGVEKAVQILTDVAIKTWLQNSGQILKQSLPNYAATLVKFGPHTFFRAASIYLSHMTNSASREDYRNFMSLFSAPLRSTMNIESFDDVRKIIDEDAGSAKSMAISGARGVEKLFNGVGAWALTAADQSANDISLIAAYIRAYERDGGDMSNFSIANEAANPNVEYIAAAENAASNINNASKKAERAAVMKKRFSEDASLANRISSNMWVLKSFSVQAYRNFTNATKILMSSHSTGSEKAEAIKSIGAYWTQIVMFNGVSMYITNALYKGAATLIAPVLFNIKAKEDTPKEEENEEGNMFAKFVIKSAADGIMGGLNTISEGALRYLLGWTIGEAIKKEIGPKMIYYPDVNVVGRKDGEPYLKIGKTAVDLKSNPFYWDANKKTPTLAGLDPAFATVSSFVEAANVSKDYKSLNKKGDNIVNAVDFATLAAFMFKSGDLLKLSQYVGSAVKESPSLQDKKPKRGRSSSKTAF